jgi:anthranilate phosphoribosyltransferase
MLSETVERVRSGNDLSCDEARTVADAIFLSDDDAVVADLLVALADKGETGDEIAAFASALLDRADTLAIPEGTADLCGTGGSGLSRFNVSTAAAFVAAACGVPIAKHGNKGSRCANGSFDLLEAMGLPIDLSPADSSETLRATGLAFLYARQYHPIMSSVAAARKRAGRRTIFNLAGPLANPAGVKHQLIGTADASRLDSLAAAVRILGRTKVLIVSGEPGIDEISISGITTVCEITQDSTRKYSVRPEEFGITPVAYDMIPSGLAESNVKVFDALLDNEADSSIADMVALNAGAVLYAADRTDSIAEGVVLARAAITDGSMKRKFEEYASYAKNMKRSDQSMGRSH